MSADNRSVGVRSFCVRGIVAAGVLLGISTWHAPHALAVTAGPSCGEKDVTSPTGVGFKILFANNGTVQQYIVTAKADDPEAVNDARLALQASFGPAGVNAPPLKIVSYKAGDNGMQIPDKAIDSCGRTLDFN